MKAPSSVTPLAVALAAALAAALATGCPRTAPPPTSSVSPVAMAGTWSYEVVADEGARVLDVQAVLPPGGDEALVLDDGAVPFVENLVIDDGGAAPIDGGWNVGKCARGCRLRYRFRLGDAADALDRVDLVGRRGGAIITAPSVFLLRPRTAGRGRYRFHLRTPEGTRFVTGVRPAADGAASTYEADVATMGEGPFSAFGSLDVQDVVVDGAHLELAIPRGAFAESTRATMTRWTETSADVVSRYYHGFPIERALVLAIPEDGDEIGFAQATGGGGAAILARIGGSTPTAAFADDWVLPHEMIHLGMPFLARRHHWWIEGVATYVEPIARVRAGRVTRERLWGELVERMPNGLPGPGDEGLDRTPTWGRVYWGGALFCLLADVEIRAQTGNARSLDDALRAIVADGGDIAVQWTLERVFDVGDRATGTHVLRDLHARMGSAPVDVDLGALWTRLGVARAGGKVTFDEAAPGAAIRRAIETAP